jgi:hypothetical protein
MRDPSGVAARRHAVARAAAGRPGSSTPRCCEALARIGDVLRASREAVRFVACR